MMKTRLSKMLLVLAMAYIVLCVAVFFVAWFAFDAPFFEQDVDPGYGEGATFHDLDSGTVYHFRMQATGESAWEADKPTTEDHITVWFADHKTSLIVHREPLVTDNHDGTWTISFP